MRTIIIFALLVISALCSQRILKREVTEHVKANADWESYDWDENPFKDYTHEQLHGILGTTLKWDHDNMHMLMDVDDHSGVEDLPTEFDSRKQWPKCAKEVRDQQHCGSCWAFSGAEVLTDRFCIASNGQIKETLSPQDMVSCDTNDHGCQGGQLDQAWAFLEAEGIVSDTCNPYVSGDGKNVPHCPHGVCADGKLKFQKYRAQAGKSKALSCAVEIKKDLFANGPVQTGFMVYQDFMTYKGGVYKHITGDELGGHAVKIIGWGKDKDQEYWIAQNSWGPIWGEQGFFRIAFDQCLFDANAYAGLPKLDDFTPHKFLFWEY